MNKLSLYEPTLSDPFESMFKRFLAPMRMELGNVPLDIRLDVTEVDGAYKVLADLPGVKKEDINVRVDGNLIQINAEAKQEKETKNNAGKLVRSERWKGAISRTFTVAQDVDDSKASAKYEDGVLMLELPKKASTSSKRISIQ